MKRFKKLTICLACGLALTAGLRADEVVLPGNPYAPVVARNIFGLNPVAIVTTTQPDAPLPKITANGIMSIFGQRQVLFKVDIEVPGKPPKTQFYILAEGQREDDFEVTHINEKTGVVTFNNHGTVQDTILVNGTASTTATSGATGFKPVPLPGGAVYGGNNGGGGGINRFGGRNGGGNPGGANSVPGLRNVPIRNNPSSQQPTMSPEESILMIEAQRAQFQSVGDPTYKILPTTDMTPGNDGNPP